MKETERGRPLSERLLMDCQGETETKEKEKLEHDEWLLHKLQ